MKTYEQQTLQFGEENSTSLPGDSLASHTVLQGNEKGRMMTVTSGRKCLEQFGKFNRAGLWAKTFAASLIGMEGWYSMRCRLIWKLKATKCSRFYFQLQVSTLPTEGIGYGLLPTPTTSTGGPEPEGKTGRKLVTVVNQLLPTPTVMDSAGTTALEKIDARRKRMKERNNGRNGTKYSGNGFGFTLGEMLQRGLLPTPSAADNRDMGGPNTPAVQRRIQIGKQVGLTMMVDGQLNPLFVTEMMGFLWIG